MSTSNFPANTRRIFCALNPKRAGCRHDPARSTGDDACPFTTPDWDFLLRHGKFPARNKRMAMQLKNLVSLTEASRLAIREHAGQIRQQCLSQ